MERTHFLRQTEAPDMRENGVLVLVEPGYKDAAEARKHLKSLEPGTYHLATFVEANIEVKPPVMPTTNVVARGKTFVSRAPKAKPTVVKPDGKASKGK